MASNSFVLLFVIFIINSWVNLTSGVAPVHVHIAYGSLADQMQVTYGSYEDCDNSYVVYGTSSNSLNNKVNATKTRFKDGNEFGHQYVYNVLLENLAQGQKYYYACACEGDATNTFSFTAKPTGNNWTANLLVYGDMGRTLGPQALPALIKEANSGWPTAAIHIGDFAYDMDSAGGVNGDIFMSQIEPIASQIPYMVAVGNHESGYNYSQYLNRFNMPNTNDNMWFSWDLSNVHFIAYSTEVYFFDQEYPAFNRDVQMAWLEQDLIKANNNRDVTPWIIAYGHRPFYCSNMDHDDCTENVSRVRAGLEDLFYNYGVDIIFEAHEHSYERLWPVYNRTVTQNDYDSPKAPVHIITGVAGCNEDLGVCVNPITEPQGPWSAFRASGSIYGYGKLQVFNSTHVYWAEIEAKTQKVLDEIWVTQDKHGPF